MSEWVDEHLDQASPDLLRDIVKAFAEAMRSVETDAAYGFVFGQWFDPRNGYGERPQDTHVSTIGWTVPWLREGSYLPE